MLDADLQERLAAIDRYANGIGEFSDMVNASLGDHILCICGSGRELMLIWKVLLYFNTPHESRDVNFIYADPGRELAAKLLDNVGLVGHGTSIGGGWIAKPILMEKLLHYAKLGNITMDTDFKKTPPKFHLEHLPEDIRDFATKLLFNDSQAIDAIRDVLVRGA